MKNIILIIIPLILACAAENHEHDNAGNNADLIKRDYSSLELTNSERELFIADIFTSRKEKNESFLSIDNSPLTDNVRKNFSGLKYYDIDIKYLIRASFRPFPNPDTVTILTSTNKKRLMLKSGRINFRIDGKDCSLLLFKSLSKGISSYFLPFMDATNGEDTYEAGRYIDLEQFRGTEIIIDFNQAYNPYCAYNDSYSCPLVPKENVLEVKIEAGEKYSKELYEHSE